MKYSCLILAASVATSLVFAACPCDAAPPNDDLANAQVIPAGASFSVAGTDAGATQEGFEKASNYPLAAVHTVWYTWTPTVSGTLDIGVTRSDGNTADIGVFEGTTPDQATILGQNPIGSAAFSTVQVDANHKYLISIGNDIVPGNFILGGKVTPLPVTAPTVSITASMPRAIRSPRHNGIFVLKLSAAATTEITVKYAIHGTAISDRDYKMLNGTVTVPAGATTAQIKVLPLPETKETRDGTVRLRLLPGTGYTVGTPNNAIVKIVRD